jgi:SAM-dependent MidA family methyltransferase
VLGYTSMARFLINCGLPAMMAEAGVRESTMAQRLIQEHEMGELFKVLAFAKGVSFDPLGFGAGDRTHTL